MSTVQVLQQPICRCAIDGSLCICTAASCFCFGPYCGSKTLAENANYKHAKETRGEDFANQIAAVMNKDANGEPISVFMGNGPPVGQPKPPKPTNPAGSKSTSPGSCCKNTDKNKGPESGAPQDPRDPNRGPSRDPKTTEGNLVSKLRTPNEGSPVSS
ncbi:hypothetical protein TWF225_005708 [Orbilia oligospora]|uniref:Uncharacterized protein n=1 Tax=Orbilia oligospora TaxID=2813651 RepID=A0A7C8PD80_ORBOL|nr:hypothetical protein TWF751_010352 [Orbilia oligospora]KAF3185231.1 hypothetical protein TWF225_005708 [Orbilia oligospora]KAF3244919.1 hypothetical protein TWF128_009624 [Orbilia oligospora]KAF3253887.1 hypothetical protein TWF217_007355 [Orbilia oligospora]KAF3293924.1 hypothetical protein TWF132_003814 [Orbilia oligospora]